MRGPPFVDREPDVDPTMVRVDGGQALRPAAAPALSASSAVMVSPARHVLPRAADVGPEPPHVLPSRQREAEPKTEQIKRGLARDGSDGAAVVAAAHALHERPRISKQTEDDVAPSQKEQKRDEEQHGGTTAPGAAAHAPSSAVARDK